MFFAGADWETVDTIRAIGLVLFVWLIFAVRKYLFHLLDKL